MQCSTRQSSKGLRLDTWAQLKTVTALVFSTADRYGQCGALQAVSLTGPGRAGVC